MVTDGALDRGLGPMSATACTAHGRPRISASASLARVKFTMSENRAVRTFQPVHAGKAFVEDDGDIGPSRRFVARTRHRKPYASRQPMISRPMGRRTETSMAPSSRRQQLAALVADRVTDAALAIVLDNGRCRAHCRRFRSSALQPAWNVRGDGLSMMPAAASMASAVAMIAGQLISIA